MVENKNIKKMKKDIKNLVELVQSTDVKEESVFKKIGQLDKKYKDNSWYFFNIEGLICNAGIDLRSINIIKYAVQRIREKLKKETVEGQKDLKNKLLYDLATSLYSCVDIQYPYPQSIETLVSIKMHNEARKEFSVVNRDGFHSQEMALVNSANILEKYGRVYEAILLYDKAIDIDPSFGMALGNKAIAIEYYVNLAPQQSFKLIKIASNLLKQAVKDPNLSAIGGQDVHAGFRRKHEELDSLLKQYGFENIDLKQNTKMLSKYEQFILKNNLILNFDFGHYYDSQSLVDHLFPNFVDSVKNVDMSCNRVMSNPIYFAFHVYNQILEAYASSRYAFYNALKYDYKKHHKKTNFVMTYDYCAHGIKFGMLKSVFCDLYNCLDKIAHLTAYYYVKEKGVLPKDIYFNWLQSEDFKKIVVENNSYQLLALRNLSLCQATIIFTVNDNYFYRLKLLKNTSKIKEQILNYFRFFRFSFLAASSIL